MDTLQLARQVAATLEDKKGEDILLLDIREVADFTDFFILVSGTSDRMLSGLADAVTEKIKQDFGLNSRIEGNPSDGWIVLDLGDAVVHLFSPDQRDYYHLEQLWERGKVLLRLQ